MRWRCELRVYVDAYGVVALSYRHEEIDLSRRFEQNVRVVWTPHEMAIAWAHDWRQIIQHA
jgi:hypothetical protein